MTNEAQHMGRIHETNYGGLILRGSVWHMRFTVKGQTVAESTHTSSRREAERILAKRKSELVEQVVLAGKKPIKVFDALDRFLKSREHMPSHQNCEIHLRYFRELPNHYLDRIHDSEIEAIVQKKRAEGYKDSTLKVSVAYFNAMIKYLDEQGYTVRKKVKPIKHDSTRIRWLTRDEYKLLLAALDPKLSKDPVTQAQKQENLDLVQLLYETGCRYSEIAELRWTQVDFAAGTVHIKRKKGSVDGTLRMTKTMREVLERRRTFEKDDVVFSTKQRPNNEGKWFKAAVRRAKLDETQGSISLHTLRHSRATHLLQKGMNLLEVQKFLGHKTISSTMVYAKVIEDAVMQKAVDLTDTD